MAHMIYATKSFLQPRTFRDFVLLQNMSYNNFRPLITQAFKAPDIAAVHNRVLIGLCMF